MSKHMKFKWLREVKEKMDFKKTFIKFQKISYSGIISFVYVGKEEILKFM